jgi:hypothetical protein
METPPVKEISFTDYSGFAPACQVFFLNSLRHFSQQLAKKRELPRSSLLETVKKPAIRRVDRAAGELEGARPASNTINRRRKSPVFRAFSVTAFCLKQNARRLKRSQKSPVWTFLTS